MITFKNHEIRLDEQVVGQCAIFPLRINKKSKTWKLKSRKYSTEFWSHSNNKSLTCSKLVSDFSYYSDPSRQISILEWEDQTYQKLEYIVNWREKMYLNWWNWDVCYKTQILTKDTTNEDFQCILSWIWKLHVGALRHCRISQQNRKSLVGNVTT